MSSTPSSLCNSCKSTSNLKYCNCGQVVYCSKACQQVDWVRHKQSCPMVVVREVEGKGKGLVAIRNISAGTVIFTEDPLIIVYKKDEQDVGFEVPGYEQFKKMDPLRNMVMLIVAWT